MCGRRPPHRDPGGRAPAALTSLTGPLGDEPLVRSFRKLSLGQYDNDAGGPPAFPRCGWGQAAGVEQAPGLGAFLSPADAKEVWPPPCGLTPGLSPGDVPSSTPWLAVPFLPKVRHVGGTPRPLGRLGLCPDHRVGLRAAGAQWGDSGSSGRRTSRPGPWAPDEEASRVRALGVPKAAGLGPHRQGGSLVVFTQRGGLGSALAACCHGVCVSTWWRPWSLQGVCVSTWRWPWSLRPRHPPCARAGGQPTG